MIDFSKKDKVPTYESINVQDLTGASSYVIPTYQRDVAWKKKTRVKFIEDSMKGRHVPVITISKRNGVSNIVDGKQRTDTHRWFQKGDFAVRVKFNGLAYKLTYLELRDIVGGTHPKQAKFNDMKAYCKQWLYRYRNLSLRAEVYGTSEANTLDAEEELNLFSTSCNGGVTVSIPEMFFGECSVLRDFIRSTFPECAPTLYKLVGGTKSKKENPTRGRSDALALKCIHTLLGGHLDYPEVRADLFGAPANNRNAFGKRLNSELHEGVYKTSSYLKVLKVCEKVALITSQHHDCWVESNGKGLSRNNLIILCLSLTEAVVHNKVTDIDNHEGVITTVAESLFNHISGKTSTRRSGGAKQALGINEKVREIFSETYSV